MRGLSDARLARTLVAMHQAPQHEWTLPRMAATAGMSRSAFAAVVTEAVGAEQATPLLAMKKAQAAATAEQLLEGKGWLPEIMRTQPLQLAMAVEQPMGEMEE
ncbi:hypothetical protein G6F40_016926 [Rhizopus arrhizus]|nr:hypothetical protein G6F40_016926 [Rhizopus arrhizus]